MEEKHQFSLDAATPLQAITTPHKLHQDSARVGNKRGLGGERRRGERRGGEGRTKERRETGIEAETLLTYN